jgi:hypothetical protein
VIDLRPPRWRRLVAAVQRTAAVTSAVSLAVGTLAGALMTVLELVERLG